MKSLVKFVFFVAFWFLYKIDAQEVIKKDTIAGTEVTYTMDQKINQLLEKSEENCARLTTNTHGNNSSTIINNNTKGTKILVADRALTNGEICRQNPRIMGYKIQLVVVKSNEEANQVKSFFRNRFPYLKVETDAALRPNYKVLAGSYFSKESAKSDLSKIRQQFKTAIAIPYRVFCVEAK